MSGGRNRFNGWLCVQTNVFNKQGEVKKYCHYQTMLMTDSNG